MEINRCPKCGGEPVYMKMYAGVFFCGYRVECFACRLHTGCCKTKDEAIAKWNEMTKGK